MGGKVPTKKTLVLIVLWAIGLNVWLFVGWNFVASRGCEAWYKWTVGPPPAGGPEVVRRLEEYKKRHGRYPAALAELGPVDGLPEEKRVHYKLIEGSDARAFRLSIGVEHNLDYAFDQCWEYESQDGYWVYWSLSQGGG